MYAAVPRIPNYVRQSGAKTGALQDSRKPQVEHEPKPTGHDGGGT
jgi:hypothetical protein